MLKLDESRPRPRLGGEVAGAVAGDPSVRQRLECNDMDSKQIRLCTAQGSVSWDETKPCFGAEDYDKRLLQKQRGTVEFAPTRIVGLRSAADGAGEVVASGDGGWLAEDVDQSLIQGSTQAAGWDERMGWSGRSKGSLKASHTRAQAG